MVNVNIKFNGRDYLLACEDGQEEDLEKLTIQLNEKFNKLKSDLGNLGEAKLLLITTIQIMDELLNEGYSNVYKYYNISFLNNLLIFHEIQILTPRLN